MIHRLVVGGCPEPGAQLRWFAKRRAMLERLDKGCLQQVLGGRAVVDEAHQEVKNGGRVFLVERLERLRIALPDAFPQRRFGSDR